MPIDWKTAETTHGLLVACVATNDKLDLKRAAQFLSLFRGEEVTYNAIENRMRVVKREASKLKERFEGGEAVDGDCRDDVGEKSKKATKAKKIGVLSGRIKKPAATGKKGGAKKTIKEEEEETDRGECVEADAADSLRYLGTKAEPNDDE